MLDMAVKSTAFTFGTVLALYLLGSAVGLPGRRAVVRRACAARCAPSCSASALLLAYAGAAVALLASLPPRHARLLAGTSAYWAHGRRLRPRAARGDRRRCWRLYVLPARSRSSALPTVLMGFSFPILQRAVQDDPRTSGRKVGLLQAANIAGCVAGQPAVGLLVARLARHHRHAARC